MCTSKKDAAAVRMLAAVSRFKDYLMSAEEVVGIIIIIRTFAIGFSTATAGWNCSCM